QRIGDQTEHLAALVVHAINPRVELLGRGELEHGGAALLVWGDAAFREHEMGESCDPSVVDRASSVAVADVLEVGVARLTECAAVFQAYLGAHVSGDGGAVGD